MSQTRDPQETEVRTELPSVAEAGEPEGGVLALMLQQLPGCGRRRASLRAGPPASQRELSWRTAAHPGLCPPTLRLYLPVPLATDNPPAGLETHLRYGAGSTLSGQHNDAWLTPKTMG